MRKSVEIGDVFGRLTVVERANGKHGKKMWRCHCSCGGQSVSSTGDLNRGHSKSCGCYRLDKVTTHGFTNSPEYRVWRGMLQRCRNKNNNNYSLYGGRGIEVCPEWSDFSTFRRDIGKRPSPGHTLDRIDNNVGYSPENCRWATKVQQENNKRSNVLISCGGVEKTVAEWSRESGIGKNTIYARLRYGWTGEEAVSVPVNSKRSLYEG
jgi:hypothetical protein